MTVAKWDLQLDQNRPNTNAQHFVHRKGQFQSWNQEAKGSSVMTSDQVIIRLIERDLKGRAMFPAGQKIKIKSSL